MIYIKGKNKAVSDVLSRIPDFYKMKAVELCPPEVHKMISSDELKDARDEDERYMRLCHDPQMLTRLKLKVNEQRLLETEEGQLCVPQNDVLRYKLALEAHEPLFSGHFGGDKTLAAVE